MNSKFDRQGPAAVALPGLLRRPWRLPHFGDRLFATGAFAAGLSVLALAGLMLYELTVHSRPSISEFGLDFIWSREWDPVDRQFGAAPAIYGTLVSSAIALVLALPIGIGGAIYLSEMAPAWLRAPMSFLVEMLAAIPSIVLGLWGVYVMVPWVRTAVEPPMKHYAGFIPLFNGPEFGYSMLAAGLILAIMILPIITAISRDTILAVPIAQREGMLALGATKWEMIWQSVLPYCRSGLVGGAILALGRALGETMAVLMVIGKDYKITSSLLKPASTAASTLASEFNEATYSLYISSLVELGLVLMGITLVVNVLARLLVWRVARAPGVFRE